MDSKAGRIAVFRGWRDKGLLLKRQADQNTLPEQREGWGKGQKEEARELRKIDLLPLSLKAFSCHVINPNISFQGRHYYPYFNIKYIFI